MKRIALLSIIVLALVGVVGWRVWDVGHKDGTASNQSESQSVAQGPGQPGIQPQPRQADSANGGKYLVVKEWGVQFPLPEMLQGDLTTYVTNGTSGGSVIFASKKLNTLTGDATCDLVKQPDGSYSGGIQASLVRINPEGYDPAALARYKNQLTFIKKIGSHEYYLRKQAKNPPITCLTGVHDQYAATEQSITDQLNTAFQQLAQY